MAEPAGLLTPEEIAKFEASMGEASQLSGLGDSLLKERERLAMFLELEEMKQELLRAASMDPPPPRAAWSEGDARLGAAPAACAKRSAEPADEPEPPPAVALTAEDEARLQRLLGGLDHAGAGNPYADPPTAGFEGASSSEVSLERVEVAGTAAELGAKMAALELDVNGSGW